MPRTLNNLNSSHDSYNSNNQDNQDNQDLLMSAPHSFELVCESGCDLPQDLLEGWAVRVVSLRCSIGGHEYIDLKMSSDERGHISSSLLADPTRVVPTAPTVDEYLACFGEAFEQGAACVISVHSSSKLCASLEVAQIAARHAGLEKQVLFLDTGLFSIAVGMVIEMLVKARDLGLSPQEALLRAQRLARETQMLVVPATNSRIIHQHHATRRNPLSRLSHRVETHLAGTRRLLSATRSTQIELAKHASVVELTSRAAHCLSKQARQNQGSLVYSEVETGDKKILRALEKPLDTNEFSARRLHLVQASASIQAYIGTGAVGIASAPEKLFDLAGPLEPYNLQKDYKDQENQVEHHD